MGLLSLRPVIKELKTLLPPRFEDLQRDFACGVVGIGGGQHHELIDSGDSIAEAVVASAAVPVMFSPVKIPSASNGLYVDGGVACRIGLDLWRKHRNSNNNNTRPAVVHLIGRSSPFSGYDSLETIGENVSVVCSPKSNASLWDLSGFDEQFEASRARAVPVLEALMRERQSVMGSSRV